MAAMIALLNASGLGPSPTDLQDYKLNYQERGHHYFLDFGSTRPKGGGKQTTIGFGYEYHIDRKYNGVSFEILGQKLGKLFKGEQDWWVGGGIGWWPIRHVKVFMQAGALFDDLGTAVQGRVGAGYRMSFFMLNVMPYIYVQTTDDSRFSWAVAVRIEY